MWVLKGYAVWQFMVHETLAHNLNKLTFMFIMLGIE